MPKAKAPKPEQTAPENTGPEIAIIEYGEKRASEFKGNPKNWRRHPEAQKDAVRGSLRELGWISPVIVNIRTGNLIDGHERLAQAMEAGQDSMIPYITVDLPIHKEALALGVFDVITGMAEGDKDILNSLMEDIRTDDPDLQALLAQVAEDEGLFGDPEELDPEEQEANYSRKIKAPIYEINGDEPPVSDLYDGTKAATLRKEIEAVELPDEVRTFLNAAADRHTVFNFRNIAEYYAHADAPTQSLMEKSALIIIDFEKAIEGGFVRLSEKMLEYAGMSERAAAEEKDEV